MHKRYLTSLSSTDEVSRFLRCYAVKKVVAVNAMKAYRGLELLLHSLLTSVLGGGDWTTSLPGRFSSNGRLGGPPKPVRGVLKKRKFLATSGFQTPDRLSRN